MAESAYHAGCARFRFHVLALMAVKKEFRFQFRDVIVERDEAGVNIVVAVMNEPWRIVSEENVNGRECLQESLNVALLEEVVPHGFVFPRAAKTAKHHTAKWKRPQVKIPNRLGERRTAIVVAFDREGFATTAPCGDPQNGFVWQVAERKEQIGRALGNLALHILVICDDQDIHRKLKLPGGW